MDLNSLHVFDKVAELESFTKAAMTLNMAKSQVSQKISQLEDDLGVRLFERTTRRIRITESGRQIRKLTQNVLGGVREIQATAENTLAEPKGSLRISAPYDVGFFLLREVVNDFLKLYPQVSLELDLGNRYVDLISEGFDLAIRASEKALQDSSLVAVQLTKTRMHFYAPAHSRWANLDNVRELPSHPLIAFGQRNATVYCDHQSIDITATARIRISDMLAAKQAVLGGIGIGLLPDFICRSEVAKGELVCILPEWGSRVAAFHAVYPSRRLLPPRTRVFCDFLVDAFSHQNFSTKLPQKDPR